MKFNPIVYVSISAICLLSFQSFANDESKIGKIIRVSNELVSPSIKVARQVNDLHSSKDSLKTFDGLTSNKSGFYLQHRYGLATWNTMSMPAFVKLNLNFDFSGGWNYDLDYYTKLGVEVGLYNRFFAAALHTRGLNTDFMKKMSDSELKVLSEKVAHSFKKFTNDKSSFTMDLKRMDSDSIHKRHFLSFAESKIKDLDNETDEKRISASLNDEFLKFVEESSLKKIKSNLIKKIIIKDLVNRGESQEDAERQWKDEYNSMNSDKKEALDQQATMSAYLQKALIYQEYLAALNDLKGLIISSTLDISSAHRMVVSGIYSKKSHKIPELNFYTGIGAGYGTAIRYLDVYSSSNAESYSELLKSWASVFKKHYGKAFHHDIVGLLKFGVNYKLNENWSVNMECENTFDFIFKNHNGSYLINSKSDFIRETKLVAGLRYEF